MAHLVHGNLGEGPMGELASKLRSANDRCHSNGVRDRARTPDRATRLLGVIRALAQETLPGRCVEVGMDTDLERELGIDSVGRLELSVRIERELGARLDQDRLFAFETPRELLVMLGETAASAPSARERRSGVPRSGVPCADPPGSASTLTEVLRWHATRTPARVHATWVNGQERRDITYGELFERARATAGLLRAEGCRSGERVGLVAASEPSTLSIFLGVLLAGATPVPLQAPSRPTGWPDRVPGVIDALRNVGATKLLAPEVLRDGFCAKSGGSEVRFSSFDAASSARPADRERSASPSDDALVQLTSGSTGDPRGVRLTHAALLANIRATGEVLRADSHDVVVSWLPLSHDMGLVGAWLGSLYHGCRLVLLPPRAFLAQPASWLQAIDEYRGTISAAPNFAYETCASRIADDALVGLDLRSWRVALNGAEPVSAATLERFRARFAPYGLRRDALTPVYGLAENGVAASIPNPGAARIDVVDRVRLQRSGVARPVANDSRRSLRVVGCGSALPGHEVRVVGKSGDLLGERCEGRIQLRGPSAARAPLDTAHRAAMLAADGWLETGDVGYLANGELYPTGRSKDLIVRAGRNVHPHVLEEAIGCVDGVHRRSVAVVGVFDARRGTERIIVVAETRVSEERVRERMSAEIQARVQPWIDGPADDVVFVRPGAIPRTTSGKVRRAACRARHVGDRWRSRARRRGGRLRDAGRSLTSAIYAGYGLSLLLVARVASALAVAVPSRLEERRRRVAAISASFLRAAGLRLSIVGREHHLPNVPCVAVCNHQGMLAGIAMNAALPARFFFTPKREFAKNRLADVFLRRLGVQYVDKHDPKVGVADIAAVAERVRSGESAVVYPEGGFDDDPGLRRFSMGAFAVAAELGVPVVPIAIRGARALWRGKTWLPVLRRGPIDVTVLPPIAPGGTDWKSAVAMRGEARRRILPHTGEHDAWWYGA